MEHWFIYQISTGQIIFKGNGAAGAAAKQPVPDGFVLILVPLDMWEAGAETADLAGLKNAVWGAVKAKRDAVIDGGASTAIGVVDSDTLSRSNISGAALGALIAQSASASFSIEWTAKDNSVHTLDATQMIALGLAVLQHVSAAHDRARALRAEVEGAADISALLQTDIETGWP